MEINVRGDGGDALTIKIDRREFPDATDYWVGNSLACTISIKAGHFRGGFDMSLQIQDLAAFRDAVERSMRDPRVSFGLSTGYERQLTLDAEADGRGHFEATCTAQDEAGMGNVLKFSLSFDQTRLPALLDQLEEALRAYPLVSKRS